MVKMTKSFNLNFDMNFDMNSDMNSDRHELWPVDLECLPLPGQPLKVGCEDYSSLKNTKVHRGVKYGLNPSYKSNAYNVFQF